MIIIEGKLNLLSTTEEDIDVMAAFFHELRIIRIKGHDVVDTQYGVVKTSTGQYFVVNPDVSELLEQYLNIVYPERAMYWRARPVAIGLSIHDPLGIIEDSEGNIIHKPTKLSNADNIVEAHNKSIKELWRLFNEHN